MAEQMPNEELEDNEEGSKEEPGSHEEVVNGNEIEVENEIEIEVENEIEVESESEIESEIEVAVAVGSGGKPDRDDFMLLAASLNADLALADELFYNDRNYEEALRLYRKVAEEETDEQLVTRSLYWIGECLLKLNRVEKACEAFENLTQRFPVHHLGASAQRRIEIIRSQ